MRQITIPVTVRTSDCGRYCDEACSHGSNLCGKFDERIIGGNQRCRSCLAAEQSPAPRPVPAAELLALREAAACLAARLATRKVQNDAYAQRSCRGAERDTFMALRRFLAALDGQGQESTPKSPAPEHQPASPSAAGRWVPWSPERRAVEAGDWVRHRKDHRDIGQVSWIEKDDICGGIVHFGRNRNESTRPYFNPPDVLDLWLSGPDGAAPPEAGEGR